MTRQGRLLGLLCVLTVGLAVAAQAGERQHLAGHVPSMVRGVPALGRLNQTNRLNLAIGLPLRNTNELEQLLRELYDPASPNFHRYLSPEEFTQRFGPTPEDYDAVTKFCLTNGLKITSLHPGRTLVGVSASAADVEKVLHTRLNLYRHPRQDRVFYAPATEPELDLAVPVLHIQGLNNMNPPRPLSKEISIAQLAQSKPSFGSGPSGSYMGNDFRKAYAPGVTLTGANQILGLVEFDGYYPGDIPAYLSQAGLSTVPLTNVLLGDFDGSPGDQNREVSLDIEVAIAMAPGLKQITVYEGSKYISPDVVLTQIADDNTAKQIGCSWSWGDHSDATDQIFERLAAQGQSFFQASGDWEVWVDGIDAPIDNPNITVVGGTMLNVASDGSWKGETVWNEKDTALGTGGGVSTNYPLPWWQEGINMSGASGSSTSRNVPDVALIAYDVACVADNGISGRVVGTSIAAPLWAAFTALINQQAAANGQPNIGFINPALYALGKHPRYLQFFHDTTIGDNTSTSSPNNYFAAGGYDLCTGWGTPTGSNTINALLQVANNQVDHFICTPVRWTSAGVPFGVTLNAFALDNTPVSSFNGTAAVYAVQVQTNVLFGRDFESGTVSDWTSESGTYTFAIDTNGAVGTRQSLSLSGGLYGAYDGISHSFTNLAPDKVEFYVKSQTNNLACAYFVAGSGKGRTNAVFHFRMDSTGTMGLTDGNIRFYTTNYVGNQWYKIDLLIDWTNKVVGYYVDDALVANNVPFCNPSLTNISTINLYNYSPAQVWYDQISFSKISSSTVALTPGNVRFTNGVWSGNVTVSQPVTNLLLTVSDALGHSGSSIPFVLPALPVPQITAHPADVVVDPGSSATFKITATSGGPLSYFWQANGTPIAGATNASYTFAPAQWTDSGKLFSCIVSNAGGAVPSQNARLSVRPVFGKASLTASSFVVGINGAPGTNYVIQTSTDLTNWTPLVTLPGLGAQTSFIDTNRSAPRRFYRISGAP